MTPLIIVYSLVSSLFLAAGMTVYKLLLSRQCQPRLNRVVLLGIILVSLAALPAVLSVPEKRQPVTAAVDLGPIQGWNIDETVAEPQPQVSYSTIAGVVLAIGCVAVALRMLVASGKILRMVRCGESHSEGDYTLVIVDNPEVAPFSFIRRIVVSRSDFSRNGQMIVTHELAHVRACHWVDLMLAHVVVCLQWYNPAAWLMLSELRAVHEYEADAAVIANGFDKKEYQYMLLEKAAGVCFHSLANSLNHSKLKNRIAMMYNSKSSLGQRMRALALVPAVAAAFAVTQIPAVASQIRGAMPQEAPAMTGSDAGVQAQLASVVPAPAPARSVEASASADKDTKKSEKAKADIKVSKAAETLAHFPGGDAACLRFVSENIKYPEQAMKDDVQGRVVVSFTINADGDVSDARIIRSVSPELDAEALRVVGTMPKWIPATNGGKAVASQFVLPVSFSLSSGNPVVSSSTSTTTTTVVSGRPASSSSSSAAASVSAAGSVSHPVAATDPEAKIKVIVNGKAYDGDLQSIPSSRVESMSIDKSGDNCTIKITLKK